MRGDGGCKISLLRVGLHTVWIGSLYIGDCILELLYNGVLSILSIWSGLTNTIVAGGVELDTRPTLCQP